MSRQRHHQLGYAEAKRKQAEQQAQLAALPAQMSAQAKALQRQINAQENARAALATNLRNEANARFTEYDKNLSEYESNWTAFEDRQNKIVERKTEADAARDARWKGVKDAAAWTPLTEFLNTEGILDLKGYQAAKDSGLNPRDISDRTKIGFYTGSMQMGDKALEQYNIDTAQADPTWENFTQKPLADINEQTKKPVSIGSVPSLTDINKKTNEPVSIGSIPSLTDLNKKTNETVAIGSIPSLTGINDQTNKPVSIGSVPSLTDINDQTNKPVSIGSIPSLTDINDQTNEPVSIGSIPSLTGINKRINETAAIGSVPSLTGINKRINKTVASSGPGHTYSSVASRSGYSGVSPLSISPRKTNINALKRESWKLPSKVSNSSSVNV